MMGVAGGMRPAGQPGTFPDVSTFEYWRRIAADRLDVAPAQLLFDFHPFASRGSNGGTTNASGTGSRSPTTKGIRHSTGAGPGSCGWFLGQAGALDIQKNFLAGATQKWWAAAYFGLTLTGAPPPATARGGFFMMDWNANRLAAGFYGAKSVVNFVAWGDVGNTIIDSGLPIDATKRVHQIWRDGSTGYYQIDGRAPVSGDIRPSTDSAIFVEVADSAATGPHLQDAVWVAVATVMP